MKSIGAAFAAIIIIAAIAGIALNATQETTAERYTVGDTRP